MSLVRVFPNCTSVLHLNAFVFLSLLFLFNTTFSQFCCHACVCVLAPVSVTSFSENFKHSLVLFSPDLRLPIRLCVRWPVNLLSSVGSLLFFTGSLMWIFSTTKVCVKDDRHVLTCCHSCHSFLHHHHHHLLFSSSSWPSWQLSPS